MHVKQMIAAGEPITDGGKVLIMLHGRGASASDILSLAGELNVRHYSLLAPQATNNTWYPFSFLSPPGLNEPWLSSALRLLADIVNDVKGKGVPSQRIFFLGFSQGACLTLEFAARNAQQLGGVVAFTGGLIGDKVYPEHYNGDFRQTPVYIGTSDPDTHVPLERVHATKDVLEKMSAELTVDVFKNMGHTISQREIERANNLIFRE